MNKMNMRRLIGIMLVIVFAGGTWFVMSSYGVFPCWIVVGRVVDDRGKPVENAEVTAYLGIGADESTTTGAKGNFLIKVAVPTWSVCKGGPPSLRITKVGYREYWGYYKPWAWGLNFTRALITMQHNAPTNAKQG